MENSSAQIVGKHFENPVAEYMYSKYYGQGSHVEVYAPAVLLFGMMLFGYVGNGLVIYATWKNKALHGSCNYLLCMACFGDILHQSAHWPYLIVTVSGKNFIPYTECLYFQTIPQIGVSLSIVMTLFVGVDRLVSVLYPTSYRHINTRIYMTICVSIVGLLAAYFLFISYSYAMNDGKDLEVMCIIIDSLGGKAAQQWFLLCVVINIVDLIVYTSVWILIRMKAGANDAMRRVFRSLQVIMFSVASGWLINALVMGIYVPVMQVPVSQIYYFQACFGFLPNAASASNVIPLYVFSHEYRQTIQQIIAPICPCIQQTRIKKVTTIEVTKSALSTHT